jgi:FkbM family methyltransferase
MNTRRIFCPFGSFHVPASPEERTLKSQCCAQTVMLGEYDFPRDPIEVELRSMVDVGCNVGASIVWACWRFPSIETVDAYDPNAEALEFARINADGCHARGVRLHHAAVTVEPHPLFMQHADWGGSRTHGETQGVAVPAIHPRDLPAADVLKVDAEGVDPDVFEHYSHWNQVKIALFEFHSREDGMRMRAVLVRERFRQARRSEEKHQGVEAWVRKSIDA